MKTSQVYFPMKSRSSLVELYSEIVKKKTEEKKKTRKEDNIKRNYLRFYGPIRDELTWLFNKHGNKNSNLL